MEGNFEILSLNEENKLSIEQRKQYYKQLREYVSKRKLTNTTKGATTIAPKLKKATIPIAISVTKAFTNKNIEWICDGKENIPNTPAIFAYTHQGLLDNFIWIPHVNQHCVILHGQEVNKLLLACQLNTGLVLVKKGDKQNNFNAKLDMIRLLLQGTSITYFPEGTWNLSPNKLHLPMSYGFLDIAKKAKVPVIPAVHEYTYDTSCYKEKIIKIHTRYGKPIYVSEEDDLKVKLKEYEETISTIKYELIEEKGIEKRSEISNQDYINFLKGSYKNLKLGKLDWKKENENIYGAQDDFYKFNYINDIPFDENGNLLEPEEKIKIKEMLKKHNI